MSSSSSGSGRGNFLLTFILQVKGAAQRGFSGIVTQPTSYRGIHMGDSFSPELVTMTPLTRGTGNHFGPTTASGPVGSGGWRLNYSDRSA